MTGFSGSYLDSDVTFLLKQVPVRQLGVHEKEQFIQQTGGHYSEVLSPERAPSESYLALFERQLERMGARVGADVHRLSELVVQQRPTGPITVVSLARAGTPVGVLVHRALKNLFGRQSEHYSVSIFRDRGLDLNALAYICKHHDPQSVVFVDGWTGKGVVGRELRASVSRYNQANGANVCSDLYVLADIAGTAKFSATRDDYLLPSAILNAPVSGLVSRTVLNEHIGPTDFHGCMQLPQLAHVDRSRHFVDTVWAHVQAAFQGKGSFPEGPAVDGAQLVKDLQRYLHKYELTDINLVKPGVGEATRVLLRRSPLLLALRNRADPYVEHLLHLAHEGRIPVLVDPAMACRALAVINTPD